MADDPNQGMVKRAIVINLVTSFARELRDSGIKLREVYLFGSFASGKQHRNSDIDVALAADDFSGLGFEDVKKFGRILIKTPYKKIEPITYPTSYFKKSDPFIDEIKNSGIRIEF